MRVLQLFLPKIEVRKRFVFAHTYGLTSINARKPYQNSFFAN